MGCECASYVGRACRDHVPSRCDGALEVWAGARSRCHHTFAGITAGLSSVRRTHGPRGSPGSEGVRQAPRRSEEILRRGMVALHIAAAVGPPGDWLLLVAAAEATRVGRACRDHDGWWVRWLRRA